MRSIPGFFNDLGRSHARQLWMCIVACISLAHEQQHRGGMLLEHRYGTKSCLFHLAKLDVLAIRPSNQVSKTHPKGDRTQCGLVSLRSSTTALVTKVFPCFSKNIQKINPIHLLHLFKVWFHRFSACRKLQSRCWKQLDGLDGLSIEMGCPRKSMVGWSSFSPVNGGPKAWLGLAR